MSLISKEEFSDLAQFNNEICVSIFIPTQRAGKEVLEEKNALHLKSLWNEVKAKLGDQGLSKERIEIIAKPIQDLIDDKSFWRHQSDGLAVFASEGILKKYTLPINFEAHYYIGKEFYLKPLAPVFTGIGQFYLLELQMDKVEFYEATRYSIAKIEVDDLTPSRLEDRVGYDYEEKHTKTKTQNSTTGVATQHGYAPATRERKNEFLRFFNAVDKGLNTILHDKKDPLVVACQDYLFPIYQEANSYKNLYPKCIPGNPSDYKNMVELQREAVKQLEPFFDKDKNGKLKEFNDQSRDKVTSIVQDVITAVLEGKVDTLFLENKEDIFGTFDEDQMKVDVHDNQTPDNISLMNLAAKKVIEQGGSVYLLESAFMPEKDSKMNALLRYNY